MSIQFNSSYDLLVIVSIFAAFVIYFSYRSYFFSRDNSILIALRFFILVLLVILILNPIFEKKGTNKKSLPWHIYIDKSLSIKYHKQPSAVAYKNGILNFLNKIKDKKINFETFSFGSVIDSIDEISNLDLNANSTNLGLIFDKINSDYKKNLGGVIIFSDGQINQGPPIQEFYNAGSKFAIHTIGIGDTTPILDVFIRSIDSPPLSIKGQDINIDVMIVKLNLI